VIIDEKPSESAVDERNEDQSPLTAGSEDRSPEFISDAKPARKKRVFSGSPEARAKRQAYKKKLRNRKYLRAFRARQRKLKEPERRAKAAEKKKQEQIKRRALARKRKAREEKRAAARAIIAVRKALGRKIGQRGKDNGPRAKRVPLAHNFIYENKVLAESQMEVVKVIIRGNPDGSFVDIYQILERDPRKRSIKSLISALNRLIEKGIIMKQGFARRHGARGYGVRLYSLTADGYRYMADKR
jgi:hypothetical protein